MAFFDDLGKSGKIGWETEFNHYIFRILGDMFSISVENLSKSQRA